RTLRPRDVTVAGNLFVPNDGPLLKGVEGTAFRWQGNVAWGAAASATPHEGIRIGDPKLTRATDGLLRPSADGAVRSITVENLPSIRTDIDGQARDGRFDAGCDQI